MEALHRSQHAVVGSSGFAAWMGFPRVDASLRRYRVRPVYVRDLAVLTAVYYAAAHLGYALHFSGSVAAVVWLAVAGLYLGGFGLWPAVVLGDRLVNNYSALPLGSALVQSAGNLAEAMLAVLVLRRLASGDRPLATLRGVRALLVAIRCRDVRQCDRRFARVLAGWGD